MFTIEGRQAHVELREQREADSIISALERTDYKAALRSMLVAAADAISVHHSVLPVEMLTDRRRAFRRPDVDVAIAGDLLFKGDYAYLVQPIAHRIHLWEIRHHSIPSTLTEFCDAVENCTRGSLDGRRVRGMDFSWRPIKERPTRRFATSSRFYQETKLETKAPDYSEDEASAVRHFLNPSVRSFLLRLAQIGKARASDAESETKALPVDELLAASLIRREYLVLCRKDSHTICTIQNPSEVSAGPGSGFTCAVCGRALRDELIQDIFALSDGGRRLATGSRWMSIWVTELLNGAGIARERIAWNAVASGDELDIMTDALGSRVFFELKDREFGLGDAYPFAYRVSRYGGTFGVIVTTDRVADEAKKFFEEQRRNTGGQILSLEGCAATESEIPQLVDRFSRNGVLQLVVELSEPLALDPVPLLSAWMDKIASTRAASTIVLQPTPTSGAAELVT